MNNDITLAVTEAQAVLALVQARLACGHELDQEGQFQLEVAVGVAIGLLDRVHQRVFAKEVTT